VSITDKVIDSTDFTVVKDYVLIEINCFADPVPYNAISISSYIAQFFTQTGNDQLIEQYGLTPTTINVLSLERTFFEKVLSLNRISYEGKEALQEKIRHFYDLHQLFHYPSLAGRLLDPSNFPFLLNILKNDQDNKTMHGSWQGQRIQDSPLFTQLETQWKELTPTYQAGLETLIWTGELPSPESILTVLQATKTFVIAFDKLHPQGKH
jgi:Nucleotidyl transferase AbiEii toxin, Type IV TA system